MCVALVKKDGAVVNEDTFRKCWAANSHGFGMAFLRNGKIDIQKGHQDVDKAYRAYKKAADSTGNGPMLLHFRIRSKGAQSKENCHPFSIRGGALIHNGTIGGLGTVDGASDTAELCEVFGDRLTKANLLECKEKVENAIGGWNKMAALYNDGTYIILNEHTGSWKDNVWYSNTYWRNGQTFTGRGGAHNPNAV